MSETDSSLTGELTGEYVAWQQRRFKGAVNRFNRTLDGPADAGLTGNLFAWHWLTAEVPRPLWRPVLEVSRNPAHAYLIDLLDVAATADRFIRGFLAYWRDAEGDDPRRAEVRALLAGHGGDLEAAAQDAVARWQRFNLFQSTWREGVRTIQQRQKKIAREVGGALDRERLALVDGLPDPGDGQPVRFDKVGLIPRLACSQSCRHCMFVWRDGVSRTHDPAPLLARVNRLTGNLLFTGGDLRGEMDAFRHAIRTMDGVTTFAILLNGASEESPQAARKLFREIQEAVAQRPAAFPAARVILQISFDEFHQEIQVDRKGRLRERIPVAHIAHIVEQSTRFPEIQLSLLHKQNRLNFSADLFRHGVFGRLARELARRGQPVRILETVPSPRVKADPFNPVRSGPVIRDAWFELSGHPGHAIHLNSSTIDAYGRAALLDASEYVNERAHLERILQAGPPPEERFDTDLMFRWDGAVTCFSAIHLWLGNFFSDGERVLTRQRTDPLLRALERFDRRLLDYYAEVETDLEEQLKNSTGPHHLFHQLTESAQARLHMTRRLLGAALDNAGKIG